MGVGGAILDLSLGHTSQSLRPHLSEGSLETWTLDTRYPSSFSQGRPPPRGGVEEKWELGQRSPLSFSILGSLRMTNGKSTQKWDIVPLCLSAG